MSRSTHRAVGVVVVITVAVALVFWASRRDRREAIVEGAEVQVRVAGRAQVEPRERPVVVVPPATGVVTSVDVEEGDFVRSGDVLATVDTQPDDDDDELERIVAPRDGTIVARSIDPGMRLDRHPVPSAFELADLAAVRVRIELAPEDAAAVQVGQRVTLQPRGGGAALGHTTVDRLLDRVEPRRIDPAETASSTPSRTRVAYATIEAGPAFVAGDIVEALVSLPSVSVEACAPLSAIQIEDGRPTVRIASFPWDRTRVVSLGRSDADCVEVDLAPGTVVVY
jgi:multidrug efflux pump subunit AcrA (membrane-fusion protein)